MWASMPAASDANVRGLIAGNAFYNLRVRGTVGQAWSARAGAAAPRFWRRSISQAADCHKSDFVSLDNAECGRETVT